MPNPVHLRHIGRNNDILNVCSLLWEAFPMMSQWGSQPPHLCGSFRASIRLEAQGLGVGGRLATKPTRSPTPPDESVSGSVS